MRISSKDPKDTHVEEKIDSCFTIRDGRTMTKDQKMNTNFRST